MIDSALDAVTKDLNQFLKLKFQLSEDAAILSNLSNLDGSVAVKELNRIVLTMVNIQEDKIANLKSSPGNKIGVNAPVFLNVHVLVSSYFDQKLTKESLRFLAAAVAFFQNKGVFLPGNSPGLDNGIEKLVFEIVNLDFTQQSQLFSSLGAKYLPSVLYRMRMLVIDEETLQYTPSPITERGVDSDLD
ncbi:MAG: hypothetical protein ACI857_003284 [Arenicella sp.]|jgi:hypothetical protein